MKSFFTTDILYKDKAPILVVTVYQVSRNIPKMLGKLAVDKPGKVSIEKIVIDWLCENEFIEWDGISDTYEDIKRYGVATITAL